MVAPEKVHRGKRKGRNRREIDLEIIETILTGTNWQTGIMYHANLNWRGIRQELKRLIEQGYVVAVDFDIGDMKEQEEGFIGIRYALTERARMWRLVAQREAELAPK